jgi:hypothetical protein
LTRLVFGAHAMKYELWEHMCCVSVDRRIIFRMMLTSHEALTTSGQIIKLLEARNHLGEKTAQP